MGKSGAGAGRWLGSDGRWRHGPPPPGWWQEHSGRWYPPALLNHPAARPAGPIAPLDPPPDADLDPEPELSPGPDATAGTDLRSPWADCRTWPCWAKLVALTALMLLVLGTLNALTS